MQGLSCLFGMHEFVIYYFLKHLGSQDCRQFKCWVYQGMLWRDEAEVRHTPVQPVLPKGISQSHRMVGVVFKVPRCSTLFSQPKSAFSHVDEKPYDPWKHLSSTSLQQQGNVQLHLQGDTKRSLLLCASSTEVALFPSLIQNKVTILQMIFFRVRGSS